MERNSIVNSRSINQRIELWRIRKEMAIKEQNWTHCIKCDAVILVLEDIYYDLLREGR